MAQKTYAITGVSNGIGRELAGLLKEAGHRVVGLDIAEPAGPVDQFIALDLSDAGSVKRAAAEVPDGLDGLCNSAGLPPRPGLETKILAVNFLGTRSLTNLLLPKLGEGASVVNLASRAGHGWRDAIEQIRRLAALDLGGNIEGFVAQEKIAPVRAYDLSKEAVILWTMASSENYLNRRRRINSISPGAVETGILQDFETAFGERMTKNVERAGRAASPKEIAHLAAFLLSPESNWVKGTDITIDGGMSAFQASDVLSLSDILLG
ncbi:MAG: SDR family oxidoreductase [Ahrensia sp.]|nr:SDR family oxidoreductase [Ahrensia sp.]